jgi:hypothetical protein
MSLELPQSASCRMVKETECFSVPAPNQGRAAEIDDALAQRQNRISNEAERDLAKTKNAGRSQL